MIRPVLLLGGLALLPVALVGRPGTAEPRGPRPVYKSPLGLAVDPQGRRAYVALRTAGTLAVVDLEAGKVLDEVAVGRGPYDVALAAGKVFVTCEADDTLVVLDAASHAVLRRLPAGQAPRGVAVPPDGTRAFVVCRDERTLRRIDLDTRKSQSLALPGWPERVILHRDADYLYLLALSSRPGEALVSLIRPDPVPRVLTVSALPGVGNARGLASKQGSASFVLLAHQRPRTSVPTTQVTQGWVFTNAVSTFSPWGIDTPPGKSAPVKVLDDPAASYADPSDVVLSADLRHALVACAGADTVLALRTDRAVVANYSRELAFGLEEGDLPHIREDLSASRLYVSARLATQANPRRLALSGDGGTLVVSNYLGDSLTVIEARRLRVRRHIPLGGPPPDAARRGEVLFNAGRLTFQGQFSCASCHPGGAADGLNWDLTRDGVGNFMNTRSLLGVRETAPYGWHGSSPTLADRATGTLRHLHRHEPQGSEVADLAAYLRTLKPPRPLPQKEADRPAAARGRALFEGKGGCVRCHAGATLQDGRVHDVGTRSPQDFQDRFDTPSLRGVSRTAPYLHDGRAATLEEIFTRYNPRHRHGAAHRLTAAELRDVIAYLNSL
jgi:YVTN family beta-propeller protein